MPRDDIDELIVRKAFIFLKENLDFEQLQDALIQRELLDEREKEDLICRDQCKAFWCERYLKLLIRRRRCNKFIKFIDGTPSHSRIFSNLLAKKRAEIRNSNIMTGVDAQRFPLTLNHEVLQKHKYFLYTELEPREIADLMFQSAYISCNDHDSITEGQQKYVRFMSLLDILKENKLYSEFVNTLQTSMKYISVLETLREDRNPTITLCECALCIQHSFTLLQKELPDADYTTAVMDHLFDTTNLNDINHSKGKIRKKSKLLKILLMKGSAACMELLYMIDTNMEREDLIQKMKTQSETKSRRGLPGLSPHLKRLSTSCLQEQKKYLLDELEPIYICDFLFEEKAIEIMTHDNITEKEKRQQQVEDLLQTLQENENDCFHYFLYIIEKNKFNDIHNVLESTLHPEDIRDEIKEQSDWKLVHKVEKVTDDPKDDQIELRITFKGRNAEQIERDLFQQLESSASGLWQLFMAYGHMIIEKVSSGSLVLQLRPFTDQAVKTLLNAKENNKLVDMIFGMLKTIKIADKIDGTEPLKIMVQVCYASQAQENTVHGNPEGRNAEQIKNRLKAYRKKLISDVEPRALASVLSKHFPKIDFDSVDHADSCPRRVERLLSLVEEGEPDLVKEFLTILKNFGYHDIVELIDPLDVHHTARNIREKIAYNFNKLLEEMQTTFAIETLSNCIGDTVGIRENILPRNGHRKQRMSNFLQFILKEDHNVVEFEEMLKHNGLEKLLETSENDQEQLVCTQNIEVEFVKNLKSSSPEALFESVITMSHTGSRSDYNGGGAVQVYGSVRHPSERYYGGHPDRQFGNRGRIHRSHIHEKSPEKEQRKEVWKELRAHLKKIEKPRNILLLGSYGTGKSSFINTVITALTGRYQFYADIGCGDKHNSTTLHKISCEEYWNPENEEDRALNLPNFIDIIGLDVQLSNPDEEETVNNQIMGLIIKGKLPENCDLLDLGKKLKAGKKIKERPEVEMLTIDIIVVVISAEDFNIPHNLLEEIYAEANVKTRKIPVFSVLTKIDKCDLSQKGLEKKKKEIALAMCIDEEKILICENYKPNQKIPDSRDVQILQFLTKICDPCFKAVKLQKVEFEEEQAPTPETVPSILTNTLTEGNLAKTLAPYSIILFALLGLIIIIIVGKLV